MANGLQRKTSHGKTKSKMRPQTSRFVGEKKQKEITDLCKNKLPFLTLYNDIK